MSVLRLASVLGRAFHHAVTRRKTGPPFGRPKAWSLPPRSAEETVVKRARRVAFRASPSDVAHIILLRLGLPGLFERSRPVNVMRAHAGIHGDQAKPAETLDPRIRGDDSQRGRPNGGEGAAVTRAPTTVRDGIQPHYGFRSVRLDRLLHRRRLPTPFPNWISTHAAS